MDESDQLETYGKGLLVVAAVLLLLPVVGYIYSLAGVKQFYFILVIGLRRPTLIVAGAAVLAALGGLLLWRSETFAV